MIDEWMQGMVWIANGLGLIYNLPQMYHTYRIKSVSEISTLSISLRFACSVMWCFYCSYYRMWDVGLSWALTLASSLQMIYYKVYAELMVELTLSVVDLTYTSSTSSAPTGGA